MSQLAWLWDVSLNHIDALFKLGSPYGLPALMGALVCSIIYYVHRRKSQGRAMGVKDFLHAIFPARILWHPSTLLDMRFWIVNGLLITSMYSLLSIGGLTCRDGVLALLTKGFGEHAPLVWPTFVVLTLATVLELLAYELAYWFGHYLFHRYAFLWEFHKVHHSAEVMTTFTELRQHPIEILAFVNLIAIATGTVFGVMTYAFGPGVQPFTLLNGNIALMIFLITWGHLRHSHMWISFTGLAGRLLQSPAHHQLHHSDNPLHWDKNLGFALACWDWLFGTLYIPQKAREDITFGVGAENPEFRTLTGDFVMPFVRSAGHVSRWFHNPAPVTATIPK
jgi:sterol desaturase/sphingolipid hydroxylase (fatty acid hydroxylase superfamily)